MILSFKNKTTQKIFEGKRLKKIPEDLQRRIERKLVQIDSADVLEDLAVPPGNRLKALSGDRDGQHSIRVNNQWRICFIWEENGASDVELVDYH